MSLLIFFGITALLTAVLALMSRRSFEAIAEIELSNRWHRHVKRSVFLVTVVFGLAIVWSSLSIALCVPLFVVALLIGLYPARSKVFGETRSLWSYLVFQLRCVAAFGGTWLAIGLLPELVRLSPGPRWLSALAGAALVVTLMWLIGRFYPQILGARPLERADVLEAFAPVTQRARCAPPALFAIEPDGARFANAIALPSTTTPRVLFGAALFERLSIAELAAVYGHELSHLEHYDQRYLRKTTAVMTSLIVLAAALTPFLETYGWAAAKVGALAWPLVVLAGWVAWMASRQSHEGDCDVRAIELTGDGENLIAGLTKLHSLARIPNRLTPEDEAANSHPTLERRIARIRHAMGEGPEVPAAKAADPGFDSPWPTLSLGVLLLYASIALDLPLAFAALAPLCMLSKFTRSVLHAIIAMCAAYLALLAIGNVEVEELDPYAPHWVAGIAVFAMHAALRAHRRGPGQPAGALALLVLGIGAVPGALMILVLASAGAELHFAVGRAPELALYCAGIAGLLAVGSAQRRLAAIGFAAIAALAIVSTTARYTTIVAHDPLLVRAPLLEPIPTELKPARTLAYPASIGAIMFSPSGRWALVKRVESRGDDGEAIMRKGFELIDLSASNPLEQSREFRLANYGYLAFIDDERALVLEATGDVVSLSTMQLADLQTGPRVNIPMELGETGLPKLTVDATAGRYTLRNDLSQGEITRLTGRIGAAPDAQHKPDLLFLHQSVDARGPIAIGYRANRYADDDISPLMYLRALLIKPNVMHTVDVVAATPDGEQDGQRFLFTTRIPPTSCVAEGGDGRFQWCLSSTGKSSLLSRIDTTTGAITLQRALPVQAHYLDSSGALLSTEVGDTVHLIDTKTLSARVIEANTNPECESQAHLLRDTLAIVEICRDSSTIRSTPLPEFR